MWREFSSSVGNVYVAWVPIVLLAFVRKKDHWMLFLNGNNLDSKAIHCLLEVVLVWALFICFCLVSQRQAFDSALLLSVLSIHFLIGKFQAFFFLLCNLSFPSQDWDRYGKVCLEWVDSVAAVTVELAAASQCISGRDSGTVMLPLVWLVLAKNEWGNENKEAGCKGT